MTPVDDSSARGSADGRRSLGPGATILSAAALLAIIGAYMIANREAVAAPASRVYAAFTGAPAPAAAAPVDAAAPAAASPATPSETPR